MEWLFDTKILLFLYLSINLSEMELEILQNTIKICSRNIEYLDRNKK
jgi:hypothetical protein